MTTINKEYRALQKPQKPYKKIVILFKGAMSLLFFVLLFQFVNAGDFLAMFGQLDFRFLILSILISEIMIIISCLKWKLLLELQKKPIPFHILIKYYFIGYYFSNLLPSNIGGDVARAYYAGKHIKSQGHAAISVFIERFTGLLLLLVLVILAPIWLSGLFTHISIVAPAVLAGFLLFLLGILVTMHQPVQRIGMRLRKLIDFFLRWPFYPRLDSHHDKLHLLLERFLDTLGRLQEKLRILVRELKSDRRALFNVTGITVLFYVLTFLNVYVSYRAFGAEPDFLAIAAVVPTAMLISMIPISLGSLGLAEGSYVFYLGLTGMSAAATLAMALLLRFKMLLNGLIGLIFYLTMKHEV